MARIHLHGIGSALDVVVSAGDQQTNRDHVAALDASLAEKEATVARGWGEKYVARVHDKGKLTAQERLAALIDPGTETFSLNTLVNWGRQFAGSKRQAPGAGVFTVLARVCDRWVVVIANDNTVASGSWWPLTPEKIQRAQNVALRLRLPVVYLVDSSGLMLPEQSRSFSGPTGAGHIFTMNARLADAGVPQVAGVFGDSIAGGGYMPIISDRVVMTEGAYMVIAGAALIKGAKSLDLTSLDIGGPEVHVHQSRCADERVPDDPTALRLIREAVGQLPTSAAAFYRHGVDAVPPRHAVSELPALLPRNPRHTYDILEVIARLVDSSLFHEVLPGVGREMVTGLARISGLWVGVIANRQGLVDEPGVGKRAGGVLYREGIAKISAFARACDQDGIPLIWLQDISGFDIGVQAEHLGLLGYGSNLIYSNSTQRSPFFTVLLRKASGAGYYAMSGMPYQPIVQLSTPITRMAVMEGRTLAIAAFNSKLDDDFEIATQDPVARAEIEQGMERTAARIEADMDPVRAAAVMDTDEIVPLAALRAWLVCLTEAAWQSAGSRRTKNPRIWSVHDLEALGRQAVDGAARAALAADGGLSSPTVGEWHPLISEGTEIQSGAVVGAVVQAGRSVRLAAPSDATGVARGVLVAGSRVEHGSRLFALGAAAGVTVDAPVEHAAAGIPAGVTVVAADTDGTIYLRPEPGAPLFVDVDTAVARSATLGLVEVMKMFTPVRAPVAGQLIKVLVEDGAPVVSGQALMWIRPAVGS